MICGWQEHLEDGGYKTCTPFPDFAPWRPCTACSVTARHGSSNWFGAQKNVLRKLRYGASHVVRPHAASCTRSLQWWRAGISAAGGAARSMPALPGREARAAGVSAPLRRLGLSGAARCHRIGGAVHAAPGAGRQAPRSGPSRATGQRARGARCATASRAAVSAANRASRRAACARSPARRTTAAKGPGGSPRCQCARSGRSRSAAPGTRARRAVPARPDTR